MVENLADLNPRARLFMVSSRDIERAEAITHAAVAAGRLIDFGRLGVPRRRDVSLDA
jgi:hypothetical protein